MRRKIVFLLVVLIVAAIGLIGEGVESGFLWWGNHEPIYIFGDSAFTYRDGVISGSGSADDPYVIEGWHIVPGAAGYGILIDHTTCHFVIRHCVIEGATGAAIEFNTVTNGRIEGCELTGSEIGLRFLNSRVNTVVGSVIAENHYGVVMSIRSLNNTVFGNSFIDNGLSGLDPEHRNAWSNGTRGNYWSDYRGGDRDNDGIGDIPYAPLRDLYPLVSPPVPWTRLAPAGPVFSGLHRSPQGMFVITSQMQIALESHDQGSGVAKILYSINGGEWQEYSKAITITGEDGVYEVSYYGIDYLGNAEAVATISFLLDNHPPCTTLSCGNPNYRDDTGQWITSHTPLTLSLTSFSTYGETKTFYAIDGGRFQRYHGPFRVTGSDGPHVIIYYSKNASGNTEPVQKVTLFKDDTPPTTRGVRPLPETSGSASPMSTVGQATTPPVSATVAPPTVSPTPETPSIKVEQSVQTGSAGTGS